MGEYAILCQGVHACSMHSNTDTAFSQPNNGSNGAAVGDSLPVLTSYSASWRT